MSTFDHVTQPPADPFAAYQSGTRPVGIFPQGLDAGSLVPRHLHPRGQLTLVIRGVVRVATTKSEWTVPPRSALWIPPDVSHDQATEGAATLLTIYVDRQFAADLGNRCRVVVAHALLKELMFALAREPSDAASLGQDSLLCQLIALEVGRARALPLELPWPTDGRLLAVCEATVTRLEQVQDPRIWSKSLGISERTFARTFLKETGLSFNRWVQRGRLTAAMRLIEGNVPIAEISKKLGYSSASAFSAMFKRAMGCIPSEYAPHRSRRDKDV